MDEYITEEMRSEIWDEIDNSLRNLCSGRNYREHSDDMVEKILPYIENIIEDDLIGQDEAEEDEPDRLAVDEDMIVTAMMMYLYDEN